MKRSWLIGAALVFSLTAVGCKDDDEDDDPTPTTDAGKDASVTDAGKPDGGPIVGIDGGTDAGLDATTPPSDAGADAGDAR